MRNRMGVKRLPQLARYHLPGLPVRLRNTGIAGRWAGCYTSRTQTVGREGGKMTANTLIKLDADPESPESFMLRPKRRRWENAEYTRWVKSQECACCNRQADDPHHIIGHGQGGMGIKAHDLFVIPLCRAHHDELHRDVRAFEDKYGSQILLLFRFLDYAIAVGVIGSIKN